LAKIDSALNADTAAKNLIKLLDNTNTKMEDWMHKFDAENKGKSHEQIMTYLADQKKQIKDIDKQFDSAIAATNTYKKSLIKK
jgi:chromosome condensin MukBEF ATPase and DNA-binding subunit MukB